MKNWLIYIFCLLAVVATAQEAKWELKKDKNDIKIYVREAPDSPFKELSMKFNVDASMSSIVALLQDIEAIPDWVYKCEESYVVKEINTEEEYYYNLIDFPWPLSDRDFVVRSKLSQDPITKVMRSESWVVDDMLPEKDGVVRITSMHLWWEFTPQADGTIAIDYYLKSDPGGYLPAWIVNLAIDQGPIQTIKRFKKVLDKPKYKNAKVAYISEMDE